MAAINEHTRKMITTAIKTNTDAYRDGWDRIFSKRTKSERMQCPKCGWWMPRDEYERALAVYDYPCACKQAELTDYVPGDQ